MRTLAAEGREIREGQAGVKSEALGLRSSQNLLKNSLKVSLVPGRDLVLATKTFSLFSLSLTTSRQGRYGPPCTDVEIEV